jgi:hypothetical protein
MFLIKSAKAIVVLVGLGLLGGAATRAYRAGAVEPAPAAAAALAGGLVAQGEDSDVVLAWKFVPGKPFYQEMTTETDQSLRVVGRHVRQKQVQTFYFRWTPVEKDGDNWQIKQRFEGVKVDIDLGGARSRFDSTRDDNPAGGLAEFYRALVGSEFTLTLSRQYKVQKVEGRDEFVAKAAAARPQLETMLRRAPSEDALRLLAETPFAGLPRGPVRPGDSWVSKRLLGLENLGEYQATYRYTYQGRDGELDKLTIAMEGLRRHRPAGEGGPTGGLKIEKGELRCTQGTGTLLFDRARGRGVYLELRLKVEGCLTLAEGRDADVTQTQTIRVKTTDANPLRRAGPAGDDKDSEIHRLREDNERLRRTLRAVEEALQRGRKAGE